MDDFGGNARLLYLFSANHVNTMKYFAFTTLLAVVAISAPAMAGPVSATGVSVFEISVTPFAGSTAALENLNLTLELASAADVISSDGTTPEGSSFVERGLFDPLGFSFSDGIHSFDLDDTFIAYVSSIAERATADGVVTTAKSSIDLSMTIVADPSHGPVSLRLGYIAQPNPFFGGSTVSIIGAGTAGLESFSGVAAASTALTLGENVLASTAASLDDNGSEESETQLFHEFDLDPGESVTFKLSAMAQGTATATAVPEPSSFLLLGMLGLVGALRKRVSKAKPN